MKCPLCGGELQEGGLVLDGVASGWVPMEQFEKRGAKRVVYTGLRTIGQTNFLLRQTRVPGAYFCQTCNKVLGIFDVTNHLDG